MKEEEIIDYINDGDFEILEFDEENKIVKIKLLEKKGV